LGCAAKCPLSNSKILKDWKVSLKKFKMVFPKDYKKALLQMELENVKLLKSVKG